MKKYVVLASGISSPEHGLKLQGEVVEVSALGCALERYIDLGAIREATEAEAKLSNVEVNQLQRESASTEELVSQLRAELEMAKARNLSLGEEIAKAQTELSKAQEDLAEVRKKQTTRK